MKSSTRWRRTAAALTTGGAALAIGAVTVPAAHANAGYGAIAYSSNGAWGRGLDDPSQATADNIAVSYCGYTDCKVLARFTACGAVAYNWVTYQGGNGATLAAAESDALARLGGGWIDSWGCKLSSRITSLLRSPYCRVETEPGRDV